jgi:hypothetical protein
MPSLYRRTRSPYWWAKIKTPMKPKNKAARALAKLSHAGPPSEDCERPDLCILAPGHVPCGVCPNKIPVSKPALAGGLFCVRKLAEQIEDCDLAREKLRPRLA